MQEGRHASVRVATAGLPLGGQQPGRRGRIWRGFVQVIGEDPHAKPLPALPAEWREHLIHLRRDMRAGPQAKPVDVIPGVESGQRRWPVAAQPVPHCGGQPVSHQQRYGTAGIGHPGQRGEHWRDVADIHQHAMAQHYIKGAVHQVRRIFAGPADEPDPGRDLGRLGGQRGLELGQQPGR